MSYSIRFSFTRERTGYRRGPRFRRIVDCSNLDGAQACAARMINSAMLYRDGRQPEFVAEKKAALGCRIARLGMRGSALWARVFAGQISQNDPRIDACTSERTRLVAEYCSQTHSTQ